MLLFDKRKASQPHAHAVLTHCKPMADDGFGNRRIENRPPRAGFYEQMHDDPVDCEMTAEVSK